MSFLFVWQTFVQAPLSVASASIGFTRYVGYLHPLNKWEAKAFSGGLIILLVVLLDRRITKIGKVSLLLWAGVVATLFWLICRGATHFNSIISLVYHPGSFWCCSLSSAALRSAV